MGCWLGISHRVGSLTSYWVLTLKENVISRTTISRVTNSEMQIDSTKSRLQEFDTAIIDRLNDEAHIIIEGGKSQPYDWSNHPFDEDIDFVEEFHLVVSDRIPSTTPGAEPPRDARDSGSARSPSTHLETSSSNRP